MKALLTTRFVDISEVYEELEEAGYTIFSDYDDDGEEDPRRSVGEPLTYVELIIQATYDDLAPYYKSTSYDDTQYGRILSIERASEDIVFAKVLHGYGYDVMDDIIGEIETARGYLVGDAA